ncbi:hypothetical protein [Serratia sp. DD3]|uniref:hypothetical protein n=1 Tax=Serratia sp. DD3 TaxID=1410619 RepID=UPI000689F62A|nr:hypothetical protein [Serratia sp. DD3]
MVSFYTKREQQPIIKQLSSDKIPGQCDVFFAATSIIRREIYRLSQTDANQLGGVIALGGCTGVKNLSDFTNDGAEYLADKYLAKLTQPMHKIGKTIELICFPFVLLPKIHV